MDTPKQRFKHVAETMYAEGRGKWKGKPSLSQLGPVCGLSKATLTNFLTALEKGADVPNPDSSTREKFESISGFRWHWAVTGEGQERTGLPELRTDPHGSMLFDGVIGIVMRLAEKVIRTLSRQPENRGLSEDRIRRAVLDALFLDRKIQTEMDLGFAAARLLNAQSGERASATFRAVPHIVPSPPEAPDSRG